jgi:hypothetical protein
MGLALLAELKVLSEGLARDRNLDFQAWIGIHTGPAITELFRVECVAVTGNLIEAVAPAKMVQEISPPDKKDIEGAEPSLGREIPATLQDLIMARLDRMEGERDVAQLAATLGREFSYELLAAVETKCC